MTKAHRFFKPLTNDTHPTNGDDLYNKLQQRLKREKLLKQYDTPMWKAYFLARQKADEAMQLY